MPAARQRGSSTTAPAVMAMMGRAGAEPSLCPNRGGRLVSVHFRHLAVHQDGVVGVGGRRGHSLGPVDDGVDAVAGTRRASRRATFRLIRLSSARSSRPASLAAGGRGPTADRLSRRSTPAACKPKHDPQTRREILPVDRLGQRRAAAERARVADVELLTEAGHEHQRAARSGLGDDGIRQLEPVHPGHRQVEEGHRERLGPGRVAVRSVASAAAPESAVLTAMPQSVR